MRRASAQIFSIGSHRKKHFSFGFRCGILSLVCRCFLKNSILYTEKLKIRIKYSFFHCRSPHGERGLKYTLGTTHHLPKWSLPTRGAWIEMLVTTSRYNSPIGRSPHGERGLKFRYLCKGLHGRGRRSPHGERGLKSRSSRSRCFPTAGRSPHGERGLKYLDTFSLNSRLFVAPHTGSVD